jgi:DNA-directed RNA polymerase subunit beta'
MVRNELKSKLGRKPNEKKIKAEQFYLPAADLDLRKKETAVNEEEKSTILKTKELFEGLINLIKQLKVLSILSEEEYDQLSNYEATDFFEAKMGADAVASAVEKINLEELTAQLREDLINAKGVSTKFVKLAKRLKLVDGMRRAKVSATSMIMRVLPVLPPDLRPMVQLSGGRFTSDLNDLYRRVINRNNNQSILSTWVL